MGGCGWVPVGGVDGFWLLARQMPLSTVLPLRRPGRRHRRRASFAFLRLMARDRSFSIEHLMLLPPRPLPPLPSSLLPVCPVPISLCFHSYGRYLEQCKSCLDLRVTVLARRL